MRRTAFAFATLVVAATASAQTYPTRPIRLVIPWPPGQATDLAARIVGDKISQSLGQPVVADNRPGAGGQIGTEIVAKAAPDGYTILAASLGPITISPLVQKVSYDAEKQLVPVHNLVLSAYVLVTAPSFPAKSAREFVAEVRANPGKYAFSSSGTGAAAHLVTEYFNSQAKLQATHVPYKGSAPAITDVISGQITYTVETTAATTPHIKSGRLRGYGISIGRRSAALPDIPTLAEAADLPGFDVAAWIGYMAPAGTPRPIIDRLSSEVAKALASPDVRERLAPLGLEVDPKNADEMGAYLKTQSTRFAEIVKRGNIRAE